MPSEDIKNLFNRFGNRSGRYHEIVREDQRTDSVGRWPLLSAVKVGEVRNIPGVTLRGAPVSSERSVGGSSKVFPYSVAESSEQPTLASVLGPKLVAPVVEPAPVSGTPSSGAVLFGRKDAKSPRARVVSSEPPAAAPALQKEPTPVAAEASGFPWSPRVAAAPMQVAAEEALQVESVQAVRKTDRGATLASADDRSLKGVFGRIGGLPDPEPEAQEDPRAVPIFRRLRRS